jgi:hypothetical protein
MRWTMVFCAENWLTLTESMKERNERASAGK